MLYRRSKVLILDEATSALDDETESKVIEEIQKLGKGITIIMIAHRLSTLKKCNRIIRVSEGEIVT